MEGLAVVPDLAPLREVVLRNIVIKQADKTFALKNVGGLVLENVTIGEQTLNGRLESKRATR